ncbi:hypothetical protein JTE90_000618 [Oedothorax gibbosus]|uniref:Uncharacterized protein n=1 Tax=Oedothorax gibbosus TaxID=931172 RepID=A0AAV6VVF9_9ARAC|nr:hypothetical protein JTE90_000618 [Oedothorax gibbosus]
MDFAIVSVEGEWVKDRPFSFTCRSVIGPILVVIANRLQIQRSGSSDNYEHFVCVRTQNEAHALSLREKAITKLLNSNHPRHRNTLPFRGGGKGTSFCQERSPQVVCLLRCKSSRLKTVDLKLLKPSLRPRY